MIGHPFVAWREISLMMRASSAFSTALFEAGAVAGAAQWVIAQRTAGLVAAAYGLQPVDHAELGRMSDEKLDAARAAGPALITYCADAHARLLRLWQREAAFAAASAVRLMSWNIAAMPRVMTNEALRVSSRSRRTALGLAAAGAAAGAPVLAPYYDRIRANLERLSRPPTPTASRPSGAGSRRRRARRGRS